MKLKKRIQQKFDDIVDVLTDDIVLTVFCGLAVTSVTVLIAGGIYAIANAKVYNDPDDPDLVMERMLSKIRDHISDNTVELYDHVEDLPENLSELLKDHKFSLILEK